MNFKYIYIIKASALLLFLIVPFIIKTIDMRLEIYPSVILPSSSGTLNISENVNINRKEIYGVTRKRDTIELDKSMFMGQIPKHYVDMLLKHKFGLEHFIARNEKTNRLSKEFTIKSKVTKAEIEETKVWLQGRLREQGCLDSILIVKNRKFTIAADKTVLDSDTVKTDTIYALY